MGSEFCDIAGQIPSAHTAGLAQAGFAGVTKPRSVDNFSCDTQFPSLDTIF